MQYAQSPPRAPSPFRRFWSRVSALPPGRYPEDDPILLWRAQTVRGLIVLGVLACLLAACLLLLRPPEQRLPTREIGLSPGHVPRGLAVAGWLLVVLAIGSSFLGCLKGRGVFDP